MNRTELLNGIFAGYETATNRGDFLAVSSYDELKAITEQQASEKAFTSFLLCDGEYTAYMALSRPWYDTVLLVYSFDNNELVYIDELIHYNGEKNERLEKMVITAEKKFFNVGEILASPLKNYTDYCAKRDFLLNIYPHKFGCIYAGYIGNPTTKQKQAAKTGYFCRLNMSYFPKLSQVEHYVKLWNELEQKHKRALAKDMEYFKTAVKYEMYNYECCYGGRYEEALAAIGINCEDMTEEQKTAYKAAYKEYARETMYA